MLTITTGLLREIWKISASEDGHHFLVSPLPKRWQCGMNMQPSSHVYLERISNIKTDCSRSRDE
jgi:hypothetical protein